jgi:hypothetical protein
VNVSELPLLRQLGSRARQSRAFLFLFAVHLPLLVLSLRSLPRGDWKDSLLIGRKLVGRLSPLVDPSIPVSSEWGYDSQFFWAISLDPFAREPRVIGALDAASYRYQRVLYPLMAWLTPGGVRWLPHKLLALNLAGYLLGALAVVRLARRLRSDPKQNLLLYLMNGGLLFALFHPMADVWAATWTLWALLFWLEERPALGAACFVAASLTKETSLLVPFALFLHQCFRERSIAKLAFLAASVLPFLGLQLLLKLRLGIWPFEQASGAFDFPYWTMPRLFWRGFWPLQHRNDLTVAAGLFAVSITSLVWSRRPRTEAQTVLLVLALFFACAGPAILDAWGGASRAAILLLVWSGLCLLQDPSRETPPERGPA